MVTPEQIKRRRKMAESLLQGATDASPVGHWTQALARTLQGGMAGYESRKADEGEADRSRQIAELIKGGDIDTMMQTGALYDAPELMQVGQFKSRQADAAADREWRQSQAAQEQSNFEAKMAQDAAQFSQTLAAKQGSDWVRDDRTGQFYDRNASGPPVLQGAPNPKPPPYSAVKDENAIDAEISAIDNTLQRFGEAQKLIPDMYTGAAAGTRASVVDAVSGWIPGKSTIERQATNRAKYDQTLGGEAAKSLAGTFKGPTTDYEYRKWERTINDPNASEAVKQQATAHFMEALQRERNVLLANKQRVQQEYGGGAAPPPPAGTVPPPAGQYQVGQRRQMKNGGWAVWDGQGWKAE